MKIDYLMCVVFDQFFEAVNNEEIPILIVVANIA
jgi:hypothetical protein